MQNYSHRTHGVQLLRNLFWFSLVKTCIIQTENTKGGTLLWTELSYEVPQDYKQYGKKLLFFFKTYPLT